MTVLVAANSAIPAFQSLIPWVVGWAGVVDILSRLLMMVVVEWEEGFVFLLW